MILTMNGGRITGELTSQTAQEKLMQASTTGVSVSNGRKDAQITNKKTP